MNYKGRIAAACLIACMVLALGGCRLALEDAAGEKAQSSDKMIGVLVTTEYLDLFDMEGYLENNIDQLLAGGMVTTDDTNAQQYQGRVYATLKPKTLTDEQTGETVEYEGYVFEGVDGVFSFIAEVRNGAEHYITTGSDPAISDGHMASNIIDNENEKILERILEGTIYLAPEAFGSTRFFNPVYQSKDGSIYAVSGQSMSMQGDTAEGASYAHTLNASYSITEDGKTVTDSICVKITLSVMDPPTKIVILEMNANSAVLSRMEYAPGALPNAIAPQADAEYIVLETHKTEGEGKERVARELYGKDATELKAFFRREDGICQKQSVQIGWPEG